MLIGKLSWRNHFFYTKSKNKRQKMVNATLKTHDKISLKLIIHSNWVYLLGLSLVSRFFNFWVSRFFCSFPKEMLYLTARESSGLINVFFFSKVGQNLFFSFNQFLCRTSFSNNFFCRSISRVWEQLEHEAPKNRAKVHFSPFFLDLIFKHSSFEQACA